MITYPNHKVIIESNIFVMVPEYEGDLKNYLGSVEIWDGYYEEFLHKLICRKDLEDPLKHFPSVFFVIMKVKYLG